MDELKVGIISKADWANLLVSDLIKRKVKTQRVDIDAELTSFTTLIVDLSYPKEMAYVLLERVTTDKRFNHVQVLVAVSQNYKIEDEYDFSYEAEFFDMTDEDKEQFKQGLNSHSDYN